MIRNKDYEWIASDIAAMEHILSTIPQDDFIDRISLESRIASSKKQLETMPEFVPATTVQLTFRGRPVDSRRSISAAFGANAVKVFADMFATVSACMTRDVQTSGPIPNKVKHQLRITHTAVGSFGFELELPDQTQEALFIQDNAMGKIEEMLRISATGDDESVAEMIADMQDREVDSFREFLNTMVQNDAWCGLEFDGKIFRHKDIDQVRFAMNRIKKDNIYKSEDTLRGQFVGFLPESGQFEFLRDSPEEIIKGKVEFPITKPDPINKDWVYQFASVRFQVVRVGQGKPRYVLMSMNDVSIPND